MNIVKWDAMRNIHKYIAHNIHNISHEYTADKQAAQTSA